MPTCVRVCTSVCTGVERCKVIHCFVYKVLIGIMRLLSDLIQLIGGTIAIASFV